MLQVRPGHPAPADGINDTHDHPVTSSLPDPHDERRIDANARIEVVTEGMLNPDASRTIRRTASIGMVRLRRGSRTECLDPVGLALALDVASTIHPDLRILAIASLRRRRSGTFLLDASVIEGEERILDVELAGCPEPDGRTATLNRRQAGARRTGRGRRPSRAFRSRPATYWCSYLRSVESAGPSRDSRQDRRTRRRRPRPRRRA